MTGANQIVPGEISLITGATRGIGRAIALELGKQGHSVVGTATSQNGADIITNYLSDNKINGAGLVLDVANQASIDAALKTINEQFGPPIILVNNAGITQDNLLARMKEDEWTQVINTNLSSVYRLSKSCLRAMMKARRGRIISIASVVAVTGNPGQVNYAAAKAGMIGFTKSLAREIGSRGITVNCVAPGYIDTDMTRAMSAEQKEAILQQIPLNRLAQPEEVAATVAFLASAGAAYITGETIHINGGMSML